MKNTVRNAAMIGAFLMAYSGFAQVKPADGHGSKLKASPEKAVEKTNEQRPDYEFSAEQMTQDLGLNEDQAEKLKSVEASMNQRQRELEKLDPEERIAREQELSKERSKVIASVLTPEQNKKLAMLKEEMWKKQRSEKEQMAK